MLASADFSKKFLVKFVFEDELHLLNIQKVSTNDELITFLRSSFKKKIPSNFTLSVVNIGNSSLVLHSIDNLKELITFSANPLKVKIEDSAKGFKNAEIQSIASSSQSSFHVIDEPAQKKPSTQAEAAELMSVPMTSSRILQRGPEDETFLRNIVREELRACLPEIVKMSLSAQQEKKVEEPPKKKPVSEEVHNGVTCDGCGMFPIVGPRYKCMECRNFDYCEACEKKNEEHDHNFLKIKRSDINAGCPFRGGPPRRGRCPRFARASEPAQKSSEDFKFAFEGLREAFNSDKMQEIVGLGETLLKSAGLQNVFDSIKVYLEPNQNPQQEQEKPQEKKESFAKAAPSEEKFRTENEEIFMTKPVLIEEKKVSACPFSLPTTENSKPEEIDWEVTKENCGESLLRKEDFNLPLKTEIREPSQETKRVSFEKEPTPVIKSKELIEKITAFAKFFNMDEFQAEKIISKLGPKCDIQELLNLYLDQMY